MLEPEDLAEVGATFGVAEQQVRRDHLIGHMLAALATLDEPSLVFFGGTALTWTHLPTGRLSEDIDLFVVGRARVAATIESTLPRRLRREFPGTSWSPAPTAVRAVDPARVVTPDGLVVRLQILDAAEQGWTHFPIERRQLVDRYQDLPGITMRVPTPAGFAAMKTLAWTDRHAARDLFDLAGLATIDALNREAAEIFRRSTGRRLARYDFDGREPPDWESALRHQTGALRPARDCLDQVRKSFGQALGWDD